MRTSAIFGAKYLRIFRNLWCVRTDKGRGFSKCGHFEDKGKGINFSRFCADVFYGRPLISILNKELLFDHPVFGQN